ncbi:MAG: hypothetical protein VCE43_07175, partial [Myxococcota bacterium]
EVVFGGHLYSGSLYGPTNVLPSLVRTADGTTWADVTDATMAVNIGIRPLAVYGGEIYIGTLNDVTGAEVWRSSDGVSWSQVGTDGLGSPFNIAIPAMAVFANDLYLGTWNPTFSGAELWRTIRAPLPGTVFVVDRNLTGTGIPAVVKVDPITGNREILSSSTVGSGPNFVAPFSVTLDADGNLIVADMIIPAIVKVNPVTGDRTIVSSDSVGSGTSLLAPSHVAVEASGDILADASFAEAILRVDPDTGDRTVVSSAAVGTGTMFSTITGMTLEANGDILVTDNVRDEIFRIDPVTGDRTIISSNTINAQLLAPDAVASDLFGAAVAISDSGDTAIVGAYQDNTAGGADSGSASVYVRGGGGNWTFQQKLEAPDGAAGDLFGVSVALSADGNLALVGAYADDVAGFPLTQTNVGSAHLFFRSGSSWSHLDKLEAPDAATGDAFGRAVALSDSGDIALVGAPADDVGSFPAVQTDAGSAHVFQRSGFSWLPREQLLAPGGAAGDGFGGSVALSAAGGTALVGAPFDDTAFPGGANAGSAHVFTGSGHSWTHQADLSVAVAAGDSFGVSVSLSDSGDTALVGAYRDDTAGGANAGSAQVFTRTGSSWSLAQQLLAADAAAGDHFGAAVALSGLGEAAWVGAYQDDTAAGIAAGSAHLFTRLPDASWVGAQVLAPDAAAGDQFGFSVSLSETGTRAIAGAPFDDTAGGSNAGSVTVFEFADPDAGAGFNWSNPRHMAIEANDDVLVIEAVPDRVRRMDPTNGDRVTISESPCCTGTGPSFNSPAGIGIEIDGDVLILANGADALFRVDAITGDRTIISDASTGTGVAFDDPSGMVIVPPAEAAVGAGMGVMGGVLGGASVPPGFDFEFDDTVGGALTAVFQSIGAELAEVEVEDPAGVNFALASDPLQLWQIDYDGGFTGDLILTFGYDESALLVPEPDLAILHYEGSAWVELPKLAQDLDADTVTVSTTSLSSFLLAGAPALSQANWDVVGTALGGTIELTIGVVLLEVTTVGGETAAQVAAAIAVVVNSNTTLIGAGIGATANGESVVVAGPVISLQSGDPGISFNGTCGASDSASGPNCDGICDASDSASGPDCDGMCDAGDSASGADCDGMCDASDSASGADCEGICDAGDSASGADCDGICDASDSASGLDCDE